MNSFRSRRGARMIAARNGGGNAIQIMKTRLLTAMNDRRMRREFCRLYGLNIRVTMTLAIQLICRRGTIVTDNTDVPLRAVSPGSRRSPVSG